jgi:hypothetical protein
VDLGRRALPKTDPNRPPLAGRNTHVPPQDAASEAVVCSAAGRYFAE